MLSRPTLCNIPQAWSLDDIGIPEFEQNRSYEKQSQNLLSSDCDLFGHASMVDDLTSNASDQRTDFGTYEFPSYMQYTIVTRYNSALCRVRQCIRI
jgi:hypothetical protein